MSKSTGILWKIFSFLVMFLYHLPDGAVAEEENQNIGVKTVCPRNYYVAKCDGYSVGTNWLRGGKFNDPNNAGQVLSFTDYYTNETQSQQIAALRHFFRTAGPTNESADTLEQSNMTAKIDAEPGAANELLKLLCDPTKSKLVECYHCPGDGLVEPSTVNVDYSTYSIVAQTWKFYTIADCYMKEFQDSTGTFEYIDEVSNGSNYLCYYNNDYVESGTSLPQKVLYYLY